MLFDLMRRFNNAIKEIRYVGRSYRYLCDEVMYAFRKKI